MIQLSVIKLTPEGRFIQEYESVTEAATEHNTNRSTISSACNGRRRLGLGFKWVYKHQLTHMEYRELILNPV